MSIYSGFWDPTVVRLLLDKRICTDVGLTLNVLKYLVRALTAEGLFDKLSDVLITHDGINGHTISVVIPMYWLQLFFLPAVYYTIISLSLILPIFRTTCRHSIGRFNPHLSSSSEREKSNMFPGSSPSSSTTCV